jgi:hypothetical protein
MLITDRDEEFKTTIRVKFNQWLGHDPNDSQMTAFLYACEHGMTGEDIDATLSKEVESIAYRASLLVPPAIRVHATGRGFATDAGPWTWAMTAGCRDLDRLLRGQRDDLRAVLAEAQTLGSTGRRVFAMKPNWSIKVNGRWQDGPDRTIPAEHADYFDRLRELAALTAAAHQQLNLVVLVGAPQILSLTEQVQFWDACVAAARECQNMILSLGNELDAHNQGVDVSAFAWPDGVLTSSGSNGGGANPPAPFLRGPWGYNELHSERRADRIGLTSTTLHFARYGFAGEGSNPGFPGTQWDTVDSEPYGFDEEDEPGRRTSDPDAAYLLGLGCGYGAGGTALSTDGIESVLLRPRQRECTRRFLQGVTAALSLK